jgi:hypothetical protein
LALTAEDAKKVLPQRALRSQGYFNCESLKRKNYRKDAKALSRFNRLKKAQEKKEKAWV